MRTRSIHRFCHRPLAIGFAIMVAACSNPAEFAGSDASASGAKGAGPDATPLMAADISPGAGDDVAALDRKMAELGLTGSMAHPYFLARECGASEAHLEAFRDRARVQVEQLARSEAADFDRNFEAGLDVVARRFALHDDASWKSPDTCEWALKTTAKK